MRMFVAMVRATGIAATTFSVDAFSGRSDGSSIVIHHLRVAMPFVRFFMFFLIFFSGW